MDLSHFGAVVVELSHGWYYMTGLKHFWNVGVASGDRLERLVATGEEIPRSLREESLLRRLYQLCAGFGLSKFN